jgi:hypothetical protein
MLTFRKGAASVSSAGARAMAHHLMEETLSPEAVAIGDYYTRNRAAELGAGPGADGEPGPEAPLRGTRPQPRRDMHPGSRQRWRWIRTVSRRWSRSARSSPAAGGRGRVGNERRSDQP